MKVVAANHDHLPELKDLFDQYRQFYGKTTDLKGCEDYLRVRMEKNESVVFVAETKDQGLAGFTQLYHSFCSVEMRVLVTLYDLFVAPAQRKKGVANALMSQAEQHARQAGADRLRLETHHTNMSAQRLYQSRQWVKDDEFYTYILDL